MLLLKREMSRISVYEFYDDFERDYGEPFLYGGLSLRISWGSIGDLIGVSWGSLGVSWGFSWGSLGDLLGSHGVLLGFSWGSLGDLIGISWGSLEDLLGIIIENNLIMSSLR